MVAGHPERMARQGLTQGRNGQNAPDVTQRVACETRRKAPNLNRKLTWQVF
jgi:hypothetical protein